MQAGLSAEAWAKALAQNTYLKELEHLRDTGVAAGVTGTPTLYLNGRKVDFPPKADVLQLTLEDEKDFQSHRGTWATDDAR